MRLVEIAVLRPVASWVSFIAILLWGALAYQSLGVSQMPDVDFPNVNVSVSWPGAAPEMIETMVMDPLEDALSGVQGVLHLSSVSRFGSGSLNLELDLDRDPDLAMQDVQAQLSQAQRLLPRGVETPSVSKTNPEDYPILWVALTREDGGPLRDLMKLARDRLKAQMAMVPGVGGLMMAGLVDPAVRLEPKEHSWGSWDLNVLDLQKAVDTEHRETPLGAWSMGPREWNVRIRGEVQTLSELRDVRVSVRGGQISYQPMPLGSLTEIRAGLVEERRRSRFKGKPAVGFGIQKQRGTSAVSVAHSVKERIEGWRHQLPKGYSLGLGFDSSKFVEESLSELWFTIILSVLLTAAVCFLFLRDGHSTLNVLLSIPTSLVGAFVAVKAFGFTLNTFTLMALTLAVGIVVDDAIMVLESIQRTWAETSRTKQAARNGEVVSSVLGTGSEISQLAKLAAMKGASRISFSAIAATLAIVAIFLPVAFMKGVIGKFFHQFGLTLSVAVLISLLEALTLTPMRCGQLLSRGKQGRKGQSVEEPAWQRALQRGYRRGLQVVLSRPKAWLTATLIFCAAGLYLFTFIPKELVPPQDQSAFWIRVQNPPGTSLEATDQVLRTLEGYLESKQEVDRFFGSVGGFGGGDVSTAMLSVVLKPKNQRTQSQAASMKQMRQDVQKIMKLKNFGFESRIVFQDLSLRGFSSGRGFPVELVVQGGEWQGLAALARTIVDALKKDPHFIDVDTDYQSATPEISIVPLRAEAAKRGVSVQDMGLTLQALSGNENWGYFSEEGHRYELRLKGHASGALGNASIDGVKSLKTWIEGILLRNRRGELVPLREVAKVEEGVGPLSINRLDRQRSIRVTANLGAGVSQGLALERAKTLLNQMVSEPYFWRLVGNSEVFKDTFKDLFQALVLGIAFAYLILAVQFESFSLPVLVILAMLFAVPGAWAALFFTSGSLNMYSFIGLLLLMGLVKKNSILLVDALEGKMLIGENVDPLIPADVHLGSHLVSSLDRASSRLRPIVMTSAATLAGAIPAALAWGPGAETRISMAAVLCGGILVSTVLTLFMIPAGYLIWAQRKTRH